MKDWLICLLVIACAVCIFLGYFWRMHIEVINHNKWVDTIRQEFLLEITAPDNYNIMHYKNWIIVKRADGSVVVKRR